jgi:hypothetical protein
LAKRGFDVTKNKERSHRKPRLRIPTLRGEARKRFVKATLTLFAAFLTFGGPTYLIYFLKRWIVPQAFLALLGLASLTAGSILFMRLIGEERKTKAST